MALAAELPLAELELELVRSRAVELQEPVVPVELVPWQPAGQREQLAAS
ncbi:hypothetical protein ES703_79789 [subsurface metagenome]